MRSTLNTALIELIEQCRREHSSLNKTIRDRFAVIVNTDSSLGVQYWTPHQITLGRQWNTDKTLSYFIEYL